MSQSSFADGADAVRRARASGTVRALARAGYVASGVLHLLVAWLAAQIALGRPAGEADESGAFRTLARAPGGDVLLWAVAVGFAALALWQLATALLGAPTVRNQVGARTKSVAKAVLYGALATSGARIAQGAGGSGSSEESLTARVLAVPGGVLLVGAVGLAIVGVGAYHVVKGARKTFLRDLVGTGGSAVAPVVVRLGQTGYVAKGIALGVVGALVVAAAVTTDPEQAGGLDEALRTLRDQPFGPVLLLVTAVGIAAYGGYSFARARLARL
ncbi:DUF1206 domain-containing protein [Promicromonospora sp. NPDC050880]|uniref:DUF1206 domain-containing protein n=1 Tax=unclassified Promicromonospora TaxID=2647929 RepID=UPI003795FD28